MKQNGKQEIIDKYDIQQGRYFNIENIIRIMLVDKLDEKQRKILDKQLIIQYCDTYKINYNQNITPEFQDNEQKETIAMWITRWSYLVPRHWMHNYDIKNKYDKTLKDCMVEKYVPIPQEYQDINKMTIFDKAYFGIIPDITGHKPEEQNEQGYTVAMVLALNNIKIPQCWYHDPKIQNNRGNTVAQLQAFIGKIPNKQWEHRADLQQNVGITVAMRLASYGIIPPNQWYHKPELKDNKNHTVEDYLIYSNLEVPKEWQTNPNRILNDQDRQIIEDYCKFCNIKINYNISPTYNINDDRNTVAMYLAYENQSIPEQWIHDALLTNKWGQTVAMLLSYKGIIPPKEWMHDINYENKQCQSLKSLYLQAGYIYINDQFIPNCKTEILNDICQICLNDGKQQFVKSLCSHNVCLDCFQNLIQMKKNMYCPVCRKYKWYYEIQNQNDQNELIDNDQ